MLRTVTKWRSSRTHPLKLQILKMRFLHSMFHAKLMGFHKLKKGQKSEAVLSSRPPSGRTVTLQIDDVTSVS